MKKLAVICTVLTLIAFARLAPADDTDNFVYDSDYRAGETSLINDDSSD